VVKPRLAVHDKAASTAGKKILTYTLPTEVVDEELLQPREPFAVADREIGGLEHALRSLIFGSDALAQQFSREPRICRSLTEVFGLMWLVRELGGSAVGGKRRFKVNVCRMCHTFLIAGSDQSVHTVIDVKRDNNKNRDSGTPGSIRVSDQLRRAQHSSSDGHEP
jgi:hypothetical protein